MAEKYFKIKKSIAKRAGLDGRMRTIVDDDYLLLSEKDLKMISLTTQERLELFGGVEYTPQAKEASDELIEDAAAVTDVTEEVTSEKEEVTNG